MLFSFFISSIVLKIENKSTVFKYEGNQKLKVKSESAAYIKQFDMYILCKQSTMCVSELMLNGMNTWQNAPSI